MNLAILFVTERPGGALPDDPDHIFRRGSVGIDPGFDSNAPDRG